eukprot:gene4812-5442_t
MTPAATKRFAKKSNCVLLFLAKNGGLSCTGITEELNGCKFQRCKVDGGFSGWSQWSNCDQPCDAGRKRSYRECNSPAPAFGGRLCEGAMLVYRTCNTHSCKALNLTTEGRFKNELINSSIWYNGSSSQIAFENKLRQNIDALYENRPNVVLGVTLHYISVNGTFSFTITFRQSSSDEIVLFLHAIEDVGALHTMPIQPYGVFSPTVPRAPVITNASAISSSSIGVHWKVATIKTGTTGFIVFYKEFGNDSWHREAVNGSSARHHVITRLRVYTLYTIRVAASTMHGNGIASQYVDCVTMQGVPDMAPDNFVCTPSSARSLNLGWLPLPSNRWHGAMAGYTVFYREYNSMHEWRNLSVSSVSPYFTLGLGLRPFTRYEINLAASTGAGNGPFAWQHCKTDQDVPSTAPSNVAAKLLSRDGEIFVTWTTMSQHGVGGIPIQYTVYYRVTRRGNVQDASLIEKSIAVSQYTNGTILRGFQSYTEVEIKVSVSTVVGEGPKSAPVYVETCRCPRSIYVSWYPNKPLIHGNAAGPEGVFAEYIRNCTAEICRICDGSTEHSFGNVNLFFNKTKDGRRAVFESEFELIVASSEVSVILCLTLLVVHGVSLSLLVRAVPSALFNEEQLKGKVAQNAHIFVPVNGRQGVDVFLKDYKFLMVLESAGSVLLTKKKTTTVGDQISSLAFSCWPPMAIAVLLTWLFGTMVWFTDRRENPEEFNYGSFVRGTLSGFWWGIVTMTTVGYGDFTPRSNLARSIAMAWMLIGPIMNSMVIGVITTAMTSIHVKKNIMLYGTSVAVKVNSSEYYLAIRRNAELKAALSDDKAVVDALIKDHVKGALINTLSAANLQNEINANQLVVAQRFEQIDGYGLVLSSDLIPLEGDLLSYLTVNKNSINDFVTKYRGVVKLTVTTTSDSESMLSIKNNLFVSSILVFGILTAVVLVLKFSARFIGRILKRKKVAPLASQAPSSTVDSERELFLSYEKSLADIERKIDEICAKQQKSVLQWFVVNKHMAGVPIWLKVRMLTQQTELDRQKKIRQKQLEMNNTSLYTGDIRENNHGRVGKKGLNELAGGLSTSEEEKQTVATAPTSDVSQDARLIECLESTEEHDR